MEGEQEYTRAVYELVQELMRQLLINGESSFDYTIQYRRSVARYADENEQVNILLALEKQGVIGIRPHTITDALGSEYGYEYEVATSRKKLEKYAAELHNLLQPSNEPVGNSNKRISCSLRLHDLDLLLKVNGFDEQVIARLHEGRDPYKLLTTLMNTPPGADVRHLEIFPSGKHLNLWQVLVKSKLGYLHPFFTWSRGRISMSSQLELSKAQVIELISKINEKYRKNFSDIEKKL